MGLAWKMVREMECQQWKHEKDSSWLEWDQSEKNKCSKQAKDTCLYSWVMCRSQSSLVMLKLWADLKPKPLAYRLMNKCLWLDVGSCNSNMVAQEYCALLFNSIPVNPLSCIPISEKIASNFSIRKMSIMMDFIFPLKLIDCGQ